MGLCEQPTVLVDWTGVGRLDTLFSMGIQRKGSRVAVCFDRNCPLDHHCLCRSQLYYFGLRDGSRDGGIPAVSAGLGPQKEQYPAFISHGSA